MKSLTLLLALAAASFARPARADTTQWHGASSITFAGTSTLHDWSGTVESRPFTATVTQDANGKPTHLVSKVEVAAIQMDTAEPDRDVKMRQALRVKEFPLITGQFDVDFDKMMAAGQATPDRLPFALSLAGKKHEVHAALSHWSLKGKVATFDLDFDVSLKAYGIEVPAVLWVLRVGDTIKVHASVKLVRASG